MTEEEYQNATGYFRLPSTKVPKHLQSKVCMCGFKERAWHQGNCYINSPTYGKEVESWGYCSLCEKPTHYKAIYVCDACEELFVPDWDNVPESRLFAACQECGG